MHLQLICDLLLVHTYFSHFHPKTSSRLSPLNKPKTKQTQQIQKNKLPFGIKDDQ